MSNSNTGKRINLATFISIILAVVILVGAVLGCGYHFGWFSKTEDEEVTEEASGAGAVISEGESNGIMLTSAQLRSSTPTVASTGTDPESTYQLTATVTPAYATNQELSWSIAWDTTWNYYYATYDSEDVYGNGWIYNITTVDISDYVSLSSTTGRSITVNCWQPFGNPLIITATTTDGTNLSATCKVDYQSYYTGLSITDCSSVTMSSSLSGRQSVRITCDFSTGTIKASGTLSYSDDINSYGKTTYTDYDGSLTTSYTSSYLYFYVGGSVTDYYGYSRQDLFEYEYSGVTRGSVLGDFSYTFFSYSINWTTFVQDLVDGYSSYITTSSDLYKYSDYGEYALLDFYNAINYAGVSNFHPFGWSYTLTDDKTGESFTASTNFTFSSLDDYPTYSVASVSLPSSITF